MSFFIQKFIQKGPFMNKKHFLLLALSTISFTTYTMMENKKQSLKKGILIAIEGIDGSGKTTLAQSMHTTLTQRGFDAVLTREPSDTELGKHIREIVQTQKISLTPKAEFLLFAADRAQHFIERIIPALNNNKLIISDRLADSSLAYQGYGRGLDDEKIKDINDWAMWNKDPHITFFVKAPINIALERCKQRSSLLPLDKENFLERVANGYEEMYKNNKSVVYVDGEASPEDNNIYVCGIIERWLKESKLVS